MPRPVRRGPAGRRRTWFVPAALAATVLLAVGIGRLRCAPSDADVRRSGEAAVAVLAPAAEASAGDSARLRLAAGGRARAATGSRCSTGDGDVAIEAETRDTAVTIDGVRRLAAGDYRWWVVALDAAAGPPLGAAAPASHREVGTRRSSSERGRRQRSAADAARLAAAPSPGPAQAGRPRR